MKRHAYLIIAHHRFEMLEKLIRVLDSESADFYIHINRNAKDVDETRLLGAMRRSKGKIYRKYRVAWGADTQVRCEMFLMEQAVKGRYDYYHLLSGVDIPLRTGREIEAFFETRTESFLQVVSEADNSGTLERVRYYYPLQPFIGRQKTGRGLRYAALDQLAYECIKVQRLLHVDRTRSAPFAYCRGGNWFSITHELAAYVLGQRKLVRRYFYCARTSDEVFLQSIVMSSPLKGTIVNDNLRLVDWRRTEHGGCSPHTFTMEDMDMLLASDRLFARKFDPDVDTAVIDALYARVLPEETGNDG